MTGVTASSYKTQADMEACMSAAKQLIKHKNNCVLGTRVGVECQGFE